MSSRGAATRAAGARRGLTLTWLVLFIASILLQYGALIRPANVLANATGNQRIGGFEIDGDLFSGTMTPAGYDWAQGASSVGVVTTPTIVDPIGSADNTNFTQGSKEGDSPLTWNRGTGTASPKTDMGNIYIASQLLPQPPGADSHLWTYLGVERAANTGTTYYDFEFNQLPNVTVNNPDNKGGPISVPNRSDGDFLVVAQQQGNSSFDISATIQQWLGSAWSAPLPAPAGAFYGLSNDAPIPAGPWTDTIATNGLIPQSSFAEMAFDLTAFGVVLTCPSQGFGEVNVRSRESISDTASLADYASAPVRIPPNCATLAWQKQDGNGNPLGGATFTVAPNPFTGSGTGLDFTDYISASAQSDATKDQDARAGFFKLINVVPGTYTVTEKTAPPGYIKDSSSRSVTLEIFEDGSISIPFVNTRKTATTTLAVVGANPANGSYVAVGQSISLTVTETNTGQSVLHGIAVGGTNSCATWTAAANKNSGAGAFSGTLNPGESVNFTCTFSAPNVSDFAWSATATGLDELNAQHDPTGETVNGRYDVLQPATKLTIVQNASPQVHAGDSVTIIVNEKNDGEGTITAVRVDGTGPCASNWVASATKVGGATFSGSLNPGESVTFTCTFLAPANDFAWTADGKGTDALANAVPSTNEHQEGTVDVVSPSTMLTIKSAPAKVHAGDTVTIVVTEKNTGDGPLTNVNVVGGGACASFAPANVATLAAGASTDFTCTFTASATGVDASWTADGKGTDALGAEAPAKDEHQEGTVIVIAPATTLGLVSAPTTALNGTSVTIVVVETNTGDDTLTGVGVTGTNSCADWTAAASKNNGAGSFSGSLAPGQSVNFSCTFTVGTSDVSWTALGHGTDSLQAPAPAANEDESGRIDVLNPATTLTLVSETPDPVLARGSTTITVREANVGDTPLTNVNVTGSPCAIWTPVNAGFDGTLDLAEYQDFSCTVADVGTSNIEWSALGHGTDPLGNAAPLDNEDEAGSIHVVNPDIDVVKTAGSSLGNQAADGTVYAVEDGSTVVYRYAVRTQDPDGLTGVTVTDDLCSPVTAVLTAGQNSGDTNANGKLEPGETWVFTCSATLSVAEDGAAVHNVATASGTPLVGPKVDDTDDANVALLTPGIEIVKTAGDAKDGEVYVTEAGTDNVVYHYAITNTGELDLVNLAVVDDRGTPGNTSDDITVCTIPTLAVDETKTCDITLTVLETTTNVAVATGHTEGRPNDDVTDTDSAVVRVPDVSITKANRDSDGIVGRGQVVTYTIDVTVVEGPVTNAVVTDTLPAGQTYVSDSQSASPSATFELLDGGRTLKWSWTSLARPAQISYQVTIDGDAPTGSQTNRAVLCVSELEVCRSSDSKVEVPDLTIAKSYAGNTGGTAIDGTAIAKIGDTLTYTLAYDLTGGPVQNGIITDTLPAGLTYVSGSATNNDEFSFVSYDATTRMLQWTASAVTNDGSVTYRVTVDVDSFRLDQPLVNVATIDSDETDKRQDTEKVFVQAVLAETDAPTPNITLPPTDGIDAGDQAPSNPGFGLMLALLVIAGIGLAAGLFAPTPGTARRQEVRRR